MGAARPGGLYLMDVKSSARARFINTTCALLEAQGYHATGLNQVVQESGSPKGSLYYYFPEGKESLAAEAVAHIGQSLAAHIQLSLQEAVAAEAIPAFIRRIANQVEATQFQTGGPLTMVAMETATSSERINLACREAYDLLTAAFASKLIADGYPVERAYELAAFVITLIEGGTMLSRTYHSGEPLRRAASMAQMLLK